MKIFYFDTIPYFSSLLFVFLGFGIWERLIRTERAKKKSKEKEKENLDKRSGIGGIRDIIRGWRSGGNKSEYKGTLKIPHVEKTKKPAPFSSEVSPPLIS